jgi:hypothetical protein
LRRLPWWGWVLVVFVGFPPAAFLLYVLVEFWSGVIDATLAAIRDNPDAAPALAFFAAACVLVALGIRRARGKKAA